MSLLNWAIIIAVLLGAALLLKWLFHISVKLFKLLALGGLILAFVVGILFLVT